jgi:hypothetical protein
MRTGRRWRTRKEKKEWARWLQSKDPGLGVIHPPGRRIDVGNASHYVAVHPDRDTEPVRQFGCFTADLHRLADWLKSCGVGTVAIGYASHCSSLGRRETFSINFSLFDNLKPLAFRGGLLQGPHKGTRSCRCTDGRAEDQQRARS